MWREWTLLPLQLHLLLPRDLVSNILSVFLEKVIRELGWGGKKHTRGFLWLFGIWKFGARCPGTQAVLSPCCHPCTRVTW